VEFRVELELEVFCSDCSFPLGPLVIHKFQTLDTSMSFYDRLGNVDENLLKKIIAESKEASDLFRSLSFFFFFFLNLSLIFCSPCLAGFASDEA